MSDRPSVPLTPALVAVPGDDFEALCVWPFTDSFVARLLRDDLPQRVRFGNCRVWVYRDPDQQVVGFGSLDVCDDYRDLTGGRDHPYIPLLAVNPSVPSRGYGTRIVQHLVDEAVLLTCRPGGCHDVLFLDVYTTSLKAIGLYTRAGFVPVSPEPLADPQECEKFTW